jgi:hypothetical protein
MRKKCPSAYNQAYIVGSGCSDSAESYNSEYHYGVDEYTMERN